MATSPSHQVGEWIGDFFENSIINYLKPIIMKKDFILNYRHPRAARNYRKEVIGIDKEGNKHKLDIVIEKMVLKIHLEYQRHILIWHGEDT